MREDINTTFSALALSIFDFDVLESMRGTHTAHNGPRIH